MSKPHPSKPIRILSVTKSTGGLAAYNLRLCQWLNRERFQVEVLCLSEGNETYAERIRNLDLTAHRMAMQRYAIDPVSDLRLIWNLIRFVRSGHYDVLIGHGSKAGLIVRLVGRLTHIPAIYRLASMSFVPRIHGRKAYLYRALEHLGSLSGGHIVTLSNTTRDEVLRLHLANSVQVTTIHTGIEITRFSPTIDRRQACHDLGLDPDRPVVGWAQRFVPQKAPLDFLRAMLMVTQAAPHIQIYMAGEGPLRSDAEAFVRDHNLQDDVTFAPWQSDVPRLLAALDVYVLTSHWEGLPQSLLEAMAMGKPCVATAVDGNVEVIQDQVDGCLYEAGDIDQLAQKVIHLLQNPPARRSMGQAAHERIAAHFGVERMIRDWEQLIEQVVRHKNKPN